MNLSLTVTLTRPDNDQWSDSGPIIKHIQLFCPSPPDYLQTHKDCMSTRAGCGRSFWTSCPVGGPAGPGLRSGPPAPSTSRDPTRAQLLTRPTLLRRMRKLILWRKTSGWSFWLRGTPGNFTFWELNRSFWCFSNSAIYDLVPISVTQRPRWTLSELFMIQPSILFLIRHCKHWRCIHNAVPLNPRLKTPVTWQQKIE